MPYRYNIGLWQTVRQTDTRQYIRFICNPFLVTLPFIVLFLLFHYCLSNFLVPPPSFLLTTRSFWHSTCLLCWNKTVSSRWISSTNRYNIFCIVLVFCTICTWVLVVKPEVLILPIGLRLWREGPNVIIRAHLCATIAHFFNCTSSFGNRNISNCSLL